MGGEDLKSAAIAGGTILLSGGTLAGAAIGASIGGALSQERRRDIRNQQAVIDETRGRDITFTQPITSQKYVYGKARVSGPRLSLATSNINDSYINFVIAIAGHEIDSFESFWVNDELIELDGINPIPFSAFEADDILQQTPKSGPYRNKIFISALKGKPNQPALPYWHEVDENWSDDHRGREIAYMAVGIVNDSSLFGVNPNISAVVKGKKVFDPRSGLTEWSDNPALVLLDYMRDNRGMGYPLEDIPVADVISAANYCDTLVPLNQTLETNTTTEFTLDPVTGTINAPSIHVNEGDRVTYLNNLLFFPFVVGTAAVDGSGKFFLRNPSGSPHSRSLLLPTDDVVITRTHEKRYTFNGVIDSAHKPSSIISSILTSMQGDHANVGGLFQFTTDAVNPPSVATFTADDFLKSGFSITSAVSRRDRFNTVKGIHFNPHINYQPADFAEYSRPEWVQADGGQKLYRDVALENTISSSMARRIAQSMLYEHRQEIFISGAMFIDTLRLAVGDCVTFNMPENGIVNKKFIVVGFAPVEQQSAEGVFDMTMVTFREAVVSRPWTPAVDETEPSVAVIPDIASGLEPVLAPSSLVLATGDAETVPGRDGTVIPYVRATWTLQATDDESTTLEYEVQFKKNTETGWQSMKIGRTVRTTRFAAEDRVLYDVRIRTIPRNGTPSAWVTQNIVAEGKSAPPPNIIDFSVETLSSGTRAFSVNESNFPVDFGWVEFRWSTSTTALWDDMELVKDRVISFPFETEIIPSGLVRIAARMFDTSHNQSRLVTYKNIRLGRRNLGNNILSRSEQTLDFSGTLGNNTFKIESADNAPNWLLATSANNWNSLPSTWATTATSWVDAIYSSRSVTYTTAIIDLGSTVDFVARVDADVNGNISTGNFYINYGTALTGGAIQNASRLNLTDDAPTNSIRGRYVQVHVQVDPIQSSGTNAVLKDLQITASGETISFEYNGLNTAPGQPAVSGFARLGVGTFTVEHLGGAVNISSTEQAIVGARVAGGAVDIRPINLNVSSNPPKAEFRIYNASNQLVDGTCDITLRGTAE